MLTNVNPTAAKQRALAAALAVLHESGPEATTMRAVAERAGVTATALYRHFEDKEALLRAAVREVAALYKEALPGKTEDGGARERLSGILDAHGRFAAEHPRYYEVLFLGAAARPVAPGGIRRNTIFGTLVEAVVACMREGVLRDDDPAEVALTLAAHAQGLVLLHRSGRFPTEERFAEAWRASFERVVQGLG